MSSLVEKTNSELIKSGLGDAELVSDVTSETSAFGDSMAIYRMGSFLMRISRDRGQEFVDLAFPSKPQTFYHFDDVDVAMGWRAHEEVLTKLAPEPVSDVLVRIKKNLTTLTDSFTGEQECFTRASIERAARMRGQAFADRLRI